jgi:hypothetical protein
MRLITISVLAVTLWGSTAFADRDRRDHRRDDRRGDRRPVVRDNRNFNRPVVRDNRNFNRPVVRDNRNFGHRDRGTVVRDNRDFRRDHRDFRRDNRRVYTGPVRANRRVIDRRPLYVNNGRITFHNGRTYTYQRPIIRQRYYDVRFRPQIIVENHPAQYGYIWVSGNWSWNGYEWTWTSGHYAPDPSFEVYYDDDSWE